MKKHYLLMAAFASAMAFTACSNDDEPIAITPTPSQTGNAAVFEIAISNEGDAMTRLARPVGSSAADNNVDKIQLVFYVNSGTTWSEAELASTAEEATNGKLFLSLEEGSTATSLQNGVLNYDDAVTESTPGDAQHITKKSYIKVEGLVSGSKYQIVAYGYNGTFPGNTGAPANENEPTAVNTIAQGLFKANTNKEGFELEEVFAAAQTANAVTLKVDANNNGIIESTETQEYVGFDVQPTLTLTRQVAGILAYMENVPVKYNDTKVKFIRIYASHKASDFYFPNTLLGAVDTEKRDFNGIITDDERELLMEFDLSQIATNYNTQTDAFYTFNKVEKSVVTADGGDDNQGTAGNVPAPFCKGYTAPLATDDGGLSLRENTIFGARYILPFDKNYKDATATLTLAFCDKDGKVITEERSITTDKSKPDYNEFDALSQWPYSYDIRCNNFYSIGVKSDTDDNEDEEEDNPLNLSGNRFTVRINDAWAVLHNMGVE